MPFYHLIIYLSLSSTACQPRDTDGSNKVEQGRTRTCSEQEQIQSSHGEVLKTNPFITKKNNSMTFSLLIVFCLKFIGSHLSTDMHLTQMLGRDIFK